MAITTAICNSFKTDLLNARHNFALSGGDDIKMSLYTSIATLDKTTTAYTATNEVAGTGYTAKGLSLTRIDPVIVNDVAVVDFDNPVWSNSTITARGCLIYNDTLTTPVADASIQVHDFGQDYSSTNGDFTVTMPAANDTSAIVRLA